MFLLDDRALLALLQEDLPHGDLTSRALGIGPAPGRLRMAARDPMVLAGVEEAARIFALLGARAEIAAPSGAERAPGAPILAVEGPAEALFAGWKVAQTLMEWASGLATSAGPSSGPRPRARPARWWPAPARPCPARGRWPSRR